MRTAAAIILALLAGCSEPKLNRAYRTPVAARPEPAASADQFTVEEVSTPGFPKASRIWFSSNSTPMLVHFEWDNWPTNLAAVFEWTTDMVTWHPSRSDGCAGSPPNPVTRNACAVAVNPFLAVHFRPITP